MGNTMDLFLRQSAVSHVTASFLIVKSEVYFTNLEHLGTYMHWEFANEKLHVAVYKTALICLISYDFDQLDQEFQTKSRFLTMIEPLYQP
jgi:hypothetical protein